jgi:small-conductance mechanosensitive channel
MSKFSTELLASLLVFVVMIITTLIIKKAIRRFSFVRAIEINRRKVIFYLSYSLIYLITASALAVIWGFDFKQLVFILSSILAVLGVGFFAQWSILSNLTSSAILFFSHPLRIGDRIKIIDSEYDYTGTVTDITGFFLFLKTDKGKKVTIPTTLVMQKGIELLDQIDKKN